MIEKKAVVDDATSKVENIILVDGEFSPGPGKTMVVAGGAKLGDLWDGAQFTTPPPPPAPVSPQADLEARLLAHRDAATALADPAAVTWAQGLVDVLLGNQVDQSSKVQAR